MANNDNLSSISNLLNSLKEIDSYIITDLEGRIHMASTENYNENTINASIYLWVVGTQLGGEFNLGDPNNFVYYQKTKKMLVQKYQDYLIILSLIDIAKFPVFKRKLYDMFNRII